MTAFGSRLVSAISDRSPLCVGIDPHPHLLRDWGLPDAPESLRSFGLAVVEAAAGRAAAIKPQVAFFERHGSAGLRALEDVLAVARDRDVLVIGDAKRGDVGTSVAAYGEAWLHPDSPLFVDALTVSAFQGTGSLASVFELASEHERGLFVLCATSNPEAAGIQLATTETGETVAATIAREVAVLNSAAASSMGSIGLVLGATIDVRDFGIEVDANTPVLAPGFGAQGGRLEDLRTLFPASAPVLAAVSRSILEHGPDGLVAAIDEAVATVSA
ncbi:orotidine-5'-phosphate decarboxylase [uncultured Agrococcus sp.]|uniref:orotidine-5'-phosphate decarboxylase n=1 Tax=uncultured Agrococcus sp. TaxID=382258 RepID=UPI0025E686FF|nr:orotidine-5'-phosphate decarboxylase [uncultured Agrococcus sp.]